MLDPADKNIEYVLLSYALDTETPIFGINPPNTVTRVERISDGDSCNSSQITLFNHNGTHVDTPRHFDDSGKNIIDYGIEDFIFTNPQIVDIPKGENEAIEINDLLEQKSIIQSCDLLLIRTGFYSKRGKQSYVDRNPWLDNQTATFLRRLPLLKAIGIDTISISSFSRLEIGKETHRILLSGISDNTEPMVIIEDMKLPGELKNLRRVFVIPLFISGVDSAPCTVFAEVAFE